MKTTAMVVIFGCLTGCGCTTQQGIGVETDLPLGPDPGSGDAAADGDTGSGSSSGSSIDSGSSGSSSGGAMPVTGMSCSAITSTDCLCTNYSGSTNGNGCNAQQFGTGLCCAGQGWPSTATTCSCGVWSCDQAAAPCNCYWGVAVSGGTTSCSPGPGTVCCSTGISCTCVEGSACPSGTAPTPACSLSTATCAAGSTKTSACR